jgi:hypothetical protein
VVLLRMVGSQGDVIGTSENSNRTHPCQDP